jgi:hypothetical protein
LFVLFCLFFLLLGQDKLEWDLAGISQARESARRCLCKSTCMSNRHMTGVPKDSAIYQLVPRVCLFSCFLFVLVVVFVFVCCLCVCWKRKLIDQSKASQLRSSKDDPLVVQPQWCTRLETI